MDGDVLIAKLKESNLLGRGGANFPVHQKWQMVKDAPGEKKYIVCNASEGEPDVLKDGWLFENHPDTVIAGIKRAIETIGGDVEAIIYLNHVYYETFKKRLRRIIGEAPISLFLKHGGYLAGEETTVIANIEGRRREPALKPPFPPQKGLYGCPTLINNVETFYYAARVAEGEYEGARLFTIVGDAPKPGVYEFDLNMTVADVLKNTGNWPEDDFFIQLGGGASGEILVPDELGKPATGAASIHMYDRLNTNPYEILERWSQFFIEENCDKCVPCREGAYRIYEMIQAGRMDKDVLDDLFFVMEKTSFCPLGRSIPVPFRGLIEKVIVPSLSKTASKQDSK